MTMMILSRAKITQEVNALREKYQEVSLFNPDERNFSIIVKSKYYFLLIQKLVSLENISGINLIFHVVKASVISIGNNSLT